MKNLLTAMAVFAASTAAHALPHVIPQTSPMEALYRDDMEKRARILAQNFDYTREQQQAIIKALTDQAPENGDEAKCVEYADQSARFAVESAPAMSDAAEHNIGQLSYDLCMLKSPATAFKTTPKSKATDAAAASAAKKAATDKRAAANAPQKPHVSGADIINYGGQIKAAIESRFAGMGSFKGKTCKLRISLAYDGVLTDVQSEGGDPQLCAAAIKATHAAYFPKPPSDAVYQAFKNFPLYFRQ